MTTPTERLLREALDGDQRALGEVLEQFRPLLRILAKRHLDSQLKKRVDPSDVVQQTCLEICRDVRGFEGSCVPEWMAWMGRILENNISETVRRHVLTQKRTVHRERSLPAEEASDGPRLDGLLSAGSSSPSHRAMRTESAAILAQLLETLPADQQEAVRLRHLEGYTLAELAAELGRSEVAVAGLLKRGLRTLRQKSAHFQ